MTPWHDMLLRTPDPRDESGFHVVLPVPEMSPPWRVDHGGGFLL